MKYLKKLTSELRTIIFTVFIILIFISYSEATLEKNTLTFINQSGDDALVKLVGLSKRTVEVPNGGSQTVNIAGGEYRIYVRYGRGPNYRYAKGEAFKIIDSATTYTKAKLTLHGVINGNYHTYGSSENEFDRYKIYFDLMELFSDLNRLIIERKERRAKYVRERFSSKKHYVNFSFAV